ncbi:MAG: S1 RNA-binding domain-containing protein, partial [Caldithrix sp.]|nr:S1 RNA-binding domain-containing protein [Caldithrix sp.]
QIDVKPIRDFDAYLGKQMNFKIVKVNHARKNIVVSSRVLIEKEMESQRQEILSTLEKGQVRTGTVKNITDFGVFIDLGGVDGLLHITDLSWGRVNHPSELVKLDQELEVMILDYNENKDRISLGLKQLQPHPWANVEEKYPVDEKIVGRVVSLTDYGAFIELEKGIEGLIHISEMSWSQHIKHPSQILNVGQEVEAVVLNVEPEEKKISLGLKQLEPDPWENIEERYPVSSVHKGIVRNLTQFGAFVELEEGIDGLVHISDLSWTKKVRHPSEIVKKGDEIEVVVLGINRDERRIALGHKQIDANPWDSFAENYGVGTDTEGKVNRIIEKGLIVTLPLGVDAFIPNNHLGLPKGKKASDVYEEGADVPAKVIEFDKENKKIVLSVADYFKDKERKEFEDYMAKQGVQKTTLEEVAKTPKEEEAAEGKPKKAEAETTSEAGSKNESVKEPAAEQDKKETEDKKQTESAQEEEKKESTVEPEAEKETKPKKDDSDKSADAKENDKDDKEDPEKQ